MASERARQLASQAWCKGKTRGKVMDADLAEAFAEIIDEALELLEALVDADDWELKPVNDAEAFLESIKNAT